MALVPDMVQNLTEMGARVRVESGAGTDAGFPDDAYTAAGAEIVPDRGSLYGESAVLLRVRAPDDEDIRRMRPGAVLIAFLDPLRNPERLNRLGDQNVVAFSMDAIPRTTRAQSMDALSSMSTIAGYKAVLLAAASLDRLFPMLMTAAGTLAPARVLVLGAGVAGLQALATARRLGAVTLGFDTRPAVREQVQSVGASFITMDEQLENAEAEGGYARAVEEDFLERERAAITGAVAESDVIITTALVPGKPAPVLITEEMVQSMKPGSVIVDLAAETGGNTALTRAGETVQRHGVTILGATNLASTVPAHASQMYSRNVVSVLGLLVHDGKINLNFEDEIVRAACVAGGVGVPAS